MNKRYNSLFIDLDDTLLDFSSDEKKAILNTLEKYNLPCSEDVYTVYSEIENWQYFNLGQEFDAKTLITSRFKVLLKMLEAENIDEISDDYYSAMCNGHKLKKGALKVLRYLKSQGYKLYLTTNGFPSFQYKRIKSSGISGFFDGIFISEEIDFKKPTKMYFEYVMNHIPESNRSKVLIIGDAPTADVLGGLNSGIDTCWICGRDKQCRYRYTYKVSNIEQLLNIL
ncbi:MAG: YjjG family noncanonical pyrimidine nucleotidase [Clostridia bacterium]|nr:YjjG family noncanonical pyrimidine nucleotidase [Clostridia bacterium]